MNQVKRLDWGDRGARVFFGLLFTFVVLGVFPGWPWIIFLFLQRDSAAWVQAVGSIGAIVFTAIGTRWQINKSRKFQEITEIRHDIQMCDVCNQMCNALISIMQSKQNMLKDIGFFKTPYGLVNSQNSRVGWKFFFSLERVEDIQEVTRALLWKNMPADLLATLFGLQKLIAQYKEFLIDSRDGNPCGSYTPEMFAADARKKHREINSEVSKLSSRIDGFKKLLLQELNGKL